LVASTSTTAACALLAAVTMLRVYCSWPGASPMMNLRVGRGEVAVGHVDGDALLALGGQTVGEQGQVGLRRCRSTLANWSCSTARLSTSRRPISVLLPSSTLPQVMKRSASWVSACAGRGGSGRCGSGSVGVGVVRSSEVTVLLAFFHRGV